MADHPQQTGEELSNDILEEVFQELHLSVVNTINTSSVIDRLFSTRVITRLKDDINRLCLKWSSGKYKLLASASAQPNVAGDRSNTSLTSVDDIAKLNLVIDDLRRDVATLTTKNSRLVKENATLTTENSRLVEENARLKDENNRECLERSSADDKKRTFVKTIEDLNNKLQRVQISRSKSNT